VQVFGRVCYPWTALTNMTQAIAALSLKPDTPRQLGAVIEGGLGDPNGSCVVLSWIGSDVADVDAGEEYLRNTVLPLLPDAPATVELGQQPWRTRSRTEDPFAGFRLASQSGYLSAERATDANVARVTQAFATLYARVPAFALLDLEVWGGAINDPHVNATAFYWRNTAHLQVSFIVAVPAASATADKDFVEASAALRECWAPVKSLFEGSYVNYISDMLSEDEYPSLYYGEHWEALRAVKRKYDPKQLLNFAQAIRP
jgi:FAD/FMN-containing dehydrogenase